MTKAQKAREAWLEAIAAAKAKAGELEAKTEAVTADDQAALDALIATAATKKTDFERATHLEQMAADELEQRKAINNPPAADRAPGVLPEGARGLSKSLKVSNIFRAVMAAGAGQNPATIQKYAKEEIELSDRLKLAGYNSEMLGSTLVPLGECQRSS